MNLPGWLSRLLHRKSSGTQKMPYSMVMLLKTPHFFSADELRMAGEKGWRKPFDTEPEPMYFIVQQGAVTMMKAGSYMFHVLHASKPYLDDPEWVSTQLPQPEQVRAWQTHTAWAAVDLMNEDVDSPEAYEAIARFVQHMSDANCAGIFLPRQQMFMPNDGTTDQGIRFILNRELPFD